MLLHKLWRCALCSMLFGGVCACDAKGGSDVGEAVTHREGQTGGAESQHYQILQSLQIPSLQTTSSEHYVSRSALGGSVLFNRAHSSQYTLEPPTKLPQQGTGDE